MATPKKKYGYKADYDEFITPQRRPPPLYQRNVPKFLDFDDNGSLISGNSSVIIDNAYDISPIYNNKNFTKRVAAVTPIPRIPTIGKTPDTPAEMAQRLREGWRRPGYRPLTIPITPRFVLPMRSRPPVSRPPSSQIIKSPPMSPNTRRAVIEAVVKRLYKPKYQNGVTQTNK